MRQHLATVMITGIFIFMSVWSSCGPVDPAEAPSTAKVMFVNSARDWTQKCQSEEQIFCDSELIEYLSVMVYDEAPRTGATAEGTAIPLNNVEVEIQLINGGGLYLLDDEYGALPPLTNPYVAKTDENGLVEFIHRIDIGDFSNKPEPDTDEVSILCGTQVTFIVVATVKTASTEIAYNYTCEAAEEEEGDDDDDK